MLAASCYLLFLLACSTSEAKHLKLPFEKRSGSLSKRDVEITLSNDKTFYFVSLDVGSDLQDNELLVDTGSSDSFVLSSQFDSSSSSSFYNNNTEFLVQYGGGSVSGTWGQDKVALNGETLGRLSFGIASESSSGKGLLGLGLSGLETTYSGSLGTSYQYSNFPILLKENGIIGATIFQVYMDEESSTSGSIIFGAVDTGKAVDGTFYELPIVNIYESIGYDEPVEFMVTLQGMGTVSSSEKSTITTTKQVALIDTGATLTLVDSFILDSIVSNLNAQENSNGYYSVSCSSDDYIVLDFGGFQIDVPVQQTFIGNDGDQCYLGLATTSSQYVVLGDTFLRAMSVVFDLDNYVIGIAQANFDGSSSVVESSGGIPSGQKASGYSDVYQSYTAPVSGGDIFSGSDDTSSLASASSTSSSASSTSSTVSSTSTSVSSTSESTSSTSESTSSSSSAVETSPSVASTSVVPSTTSSTETPSSSSTASSDSTSAVSSSSETSSSETKTAVSSTAAASSSSQSSSVSLSTSVHGSQSAISTTVLASTSSTGASNSSTESKPVTTSHNSSSILHSTFTSSGSSISTSSDSSMSASSDSSTSTSSTKATKNDGSKLAHQHLLLVVLSLLI